MLYNADYICEYAHIADIYRITEFRIAVLQNFKIRVHWRFYIYIVYVFIVFIQH